MGELNLDVLDRVYEALAAGDLETVMGFLSADVAAHVPGNSPVAGHYLGKEAVAGYVATLAERSGGTLRFEPHAVMVTGRHGAGLVRDMAERDGKTLDMNNVHVWHVVDGTLTELWVYPGDQYAWDEFWS